MKELLTNVVLDAVAMLLVRRNKVMAMAGISSTNNDIVTVESMDQPTDSTIDDDLQDQKGISWLIPNVVALPNPDKQTVIFQTTLIISVCSSGTVQHLTCPCQHSSWQLFVAMHYLAKSKDLCLWPYYSSYTSVLHLRWPHPGTGTNRVR